MVSLSYTLEDAFGATDSATVTATIGADDSTVTLVASSGADVIHPGDATEFIDGGAGDDTVVLEGSASEYAFTSLGISGLVERNSGAGGDFRGALGAYTTDVVHTDAGSGVSEQLTFRMWSVLLWMARHWISRVQVRGNTVFRVSCRVMIVIFIHQFHVSEDARVQLDFTNQSDVLGQISLSRVGGGGILDKMGLPLVTSRWSCL